MEGEGEDGGGGEGKKEEAEGGREGGGEGGRRGRRRERERKERGRFVGTRPGSIQLQYHSKGSTNTVSGPVSEEEDSADG